MISHARPFARRAAAIALGGFLAGCGGSNSNAPAIPTDRQPSSTQSNRVDASGALASAAAKIHKCATKAKPCIERVLLISIDGMHGVDLENFIESYPRSALAGLTRTGVTYADARTSLPTDSFPGLLALTTGGHPASTGVYYEVNYDRSLYPPGSHCTGPVGATVAFDESIDYNPDDINAGGGINPATLTLEKNGALCSPVFPSHYLRVNTIFEAVKAAGGRTAWSDKEHSYEILNGPSGHGVDDLYDLEIAAGGTTGSETATQQYDDLKVAAILNEIDGKSSTGSSGVGVPALFGMNFQAVSVGQKLKVEGTNVSPDPLAGMPGGYLNAAGVPGPLLASGLAHTDASIGKMLAELAKTGLADSTLVIISAKHGQTPIDITKRRGIAGAGGTLGTALAANNVGFIQTDDLALIWLNDRSQANETSAFENLRTLAVPLGFENGTLYTATQAPIGYGAATDSRTPDFSIKVDRGVIYTGGTKIAEHGGFSDEDSHVALLLSAPGIAAARITQPVETTQVAPTILDELGIDPRKLQAVQREGTAVLPGVEK